MRKISICASAIGRAKASSSGVPSATFLVIASQPIITGAFSMTRQAIQLGWFLQLKIT
jgi:hypothetical protein